jgi:hypothetical protein
MLLRVVGAAILPQEPTPDAGTRAGTGRAFNYLDIKILGRRPGYKGTSVATHST